MAGERRRYLRVLFEETIQVETEEWTDSMATGLDISLNGTRFHCEHSLSEGGKVKITFRPDLVLEGDVRWCWPIEWYYQAAVEFSEIAEEDQTALRNYISETTGEPYPEFSEEEEEEETSDATEDDTLDSLEEELGEEEELFGDEILLDDGGDDPTIAGNMLTPFAFADKSVVLVDHDTERIETLTDYLSKRNHFSVTSTDRASRLWPMLKGTSADAILLSWDLPDEEPIELLRSINQRAPGIPVIFLAGPVSLEERLEGLNEGAFDFITRPVALSSISQSLLKLFASNSTPPQEIASEDDLLLGSEDDLDFSNDFLDEELEL